MKKEYKKGKSQFIWCLLFPYVCICPEITSYFTNNLGLILGSPYITMFFTYILFIIIKKLRKRINKHKLKPLNYYVEKNQQIIKPKINYEDIKQKCPYCNMESNQNKCSFCGNDKRDFRKTHIYIKQHNPLCPYCGTLMDNNKTVCKFCGHDRKKKKEGKEEKRSRRISKSVQREVWKRDEGRCVECKSKELLEFDHIIPFSRGGSNTVRNIQLLCESCNRKKSNNI